MERIWLAVSCAALPSLGFRIATFAYVVVSNVTLATPRGAKGWLAAVHDAQVGQALALLHNEPGRAWTVDELARKVALSRSALAERFATLVGEPPMQYLTHWRLALAARTLRSVANSVF